MLQLTNNTGFPGMLFTSPDPEAIDSVYAIVKGTFAIGDQVTVAEEQVPIADAPEYHGDPAASSLRVPSDVSLIKPGADVLLLGHAHAPGGRSVTQMDVSVTVGGLHKTVRVFGDRFWQSDGVGHSMTPPAPFTMMPLVWERAYGGSDDRGSEPRNPVGTGYRSRGAESEVHGMPVPNLEDPDHLISSWRDNPPPACFAPTDAYWEPRRSFAGTYHEQWEKTRAPYLPLDFNPYFFQMAPPGLVTRGYFQGAESIEVRGATPEGILRFQIPFLRVRHVYVVDGEPYMRWAHIDTVIIEPDHRRVMLVWRSALQCDKKVSRVNQVMADVRTAA